MKNYEHKQKITCMQAEIHMKTRREHFQNTKGTCIVTHGFVVHSCAQERGKNKQGCTVTPWRVNRMDNWAFKSSLCAHVLKGTQRGHCFTLKGRSMREEKLWVFTMHLCAQGKGKHTVACWKDKWVMPHDALMHSKAKRVHCHTRKGRRERFCAFVMCSRRKHGHAGHSFQG